MKYRLLLEQVSSGNLINTQTKFINISMEEAVALECVLNEKFNTTAFRAAPMDKGIGNGDYTYGKVDLCEKYNLEEEFKNVSFPKSSMK